MVEIAMTENWDVCVAHMERNRQTIGSVIADGVAAGEFGSARHRLAAGCTWLR